MAELADALDLGSSAREGVGVQVSPGARRISEMRTRFSDLVFSYWGNSAATAAASRAVCGRHTSPTSCAVCCAPRWRRTAPYPPRAGATILPPPAPTPPTPHARATSRPAYPLSPAAAPALGAPSEPLFHHAVSKRPDHQLYAIMRPRLCHGGRQVGLHRRWL